MQNRWTVVLGAAFVLGLGGCIIVADDGGGGGGGGGGTDGGTGTYYYYEGCTGSGSCAEGACYEIGYTDPGGAGTSYASMCTEPCSSMTCPVGGACYAIGGMADYYCYKQCAWGAGGCPSGFACTPVELTTGGWDYVCLPGFEDPGLPAYASCPGGGTCAWPNECYTITYRDTTGAVGSANQCTRECTVQEECIGDALCLNIEMMDRYLCYNLCDFDTDCAEGFVCEPVRLTTGGTTNVCLPARF